MCTCGASFKYPQQQQQKSKPCEHIPFIESTNLFFSVLMVSFPGRYSINKVCLNFVVGGERNCVNVFYLFDRVFGGNIELTCLQAICTPSSTQSPHHSEDLQTYILGFRTHFILVSSLVL